MAGRVDAELESTTELTELPFLCRRRRARAGLSNPRESRASSGRLTTVEGCLKSKPAWRDASSAHHEDTGGRDELDARLSLWSG